MVIILIYVLFGMILYCFILPVIEQLATVVVQWLENIKGDLMLKATDIQNKITEETLSAEPTATNVIGFQIPNEQYYDEEDDEDD